VERLRDRFQGTLMGVAIGDGLGAPFEGTPCVRPEAVRDVLAQTGALRYTDDAHMTLGVAASLVARRGFDGAHMAETFARNFEAEPWRGYGAGPPRVFRLLRQGVPWDRAGRTLFGGSGSFGNGAAMRVAPVALAYFQDPDRAACVAKQTALITHTHELGVEGAVLQARAIAHLVALTESEPFDPAGFVDLLASSAASAVYREKLRAIKQLLPDVPPEAAARRVGNGIAAHEAVPAALYAFVRHPDSFPEAVSCAIRLGGDTDTIASMTGALAGAKLGASAIPVRWSERVEGASRLRKLADALLALAIQNSAGEARTRA